LAMIPMMPHIHTNLFATQTDYLCREEPRVVHQIQGLRAR